MLDKVRVTVEALQGNGFQVEYFDTASEAKDFLLKSISKDVSVGFGGSNTLQDMNLYERLRERGNRVYWHRFPMPGEDRRSTMKLAMMTDVYLSGTNAITMDGKIINVDGTGNRLAGMLFGHEHLYIVTGINKITKNYEEAMIRIKNVAAPMSAKIIGRQTPCAVTGKCSSCTSAQRICNATLILERQHGGIPTTIVLIGEALGF